MRTTLDRTGAGVTDAASRDELPDVGYYYALKADVPSIRVNGLPSGAIVHTRRMTEADARARHGFAPDAAIVCITVKLKAMREAGVPMPEFGPAPPRSEWPSQ